MPRTHEDQNIPQQNAVNMGSSNNIEASSSDQLLFDENQELNYRTTSDILFEVLQKHTAINRFAEPHSLKMARDYFLAHNPQIHVVNEFLILQAKDEDNSLEATSALYRYPSHLQSFQCSLANINIHNNVLHRDPTLVLDAGEIALLENIELTTSNLIETVSILNKYTNSVLSLHQMLQTFKHICDDARGERISPPQLKLLFFILVSEGKQ